MHKQYKLCPHFWCGFFIPCVFAQGFFLQKGKQDMQLTLIKNPDVSASLAYKVARVVYAETKAISLTVVEAMTSMIKNISDKNGIDIATVITDKEIFDVLDEKSDRFQELNVHASNRNFQMCLRVAQRMLMGGLDDTCWGATKFHRADDLPQWAIARGYIADIDGFLFYL